MKDKKRVFIISGIVLVVVATFLYLFTRQDKETSFTLLEKQWLQSNKSKVIDISILKDIPVINYNGNGLLFDFINDLEDVTGLDFNPIAYKLDDEVRSDYSFRVVSNRNDNDILIYSDNYVLLTRSNVKYNKLSEIDGLNIGVLSDNLDVVSSVMEGPRVTFNAYDDMDSLISSMDDSDDAMDAIVLPKISNLDVILANDNLNISYNINEMKLDYVIRLGNDDKLNQIISKYYKKWSDKNYDDSFGKHFSSNYYAFSNIGDKEKAEFKSKRYVYGFVDNKPYDLLVKDNLYGINVAFLDSFSKVAEIDIEHKKYNDFESLKGAFDNGDVDLFFNNVSVSDYVVSNVDLVSNYDEEIVVLTLPNNKVTVSSLKSLVGSKVACIYNSKVASYLMNMGLDVSTYFSVSDLVSKVNDDDIVVLDSEVYNFYSSKELSKYKSVYAVKMNDEYSFKVNSSSDNGLFIKYFNFYLSFVSNQEISNVGYSNLVDVTSTSGFKLVVIIGISVLVVGLVVYLVFQNKKEGRHKKIVVSKDSKIKYIDVLTSLKNRNYLNDNIDIWDETRVYPQCIINVDLNNIAYINDNYGHAEGDKVIKEAANILIKTQITNSEIMRTNGNEFLIYMIGYDEKQVISYIRKLNKEFKDLSHSFGAAIGYSIINDEIKTIDDAINEATYDMRNNKEESR